MALVKVESNGEAHASPNGTHSQPSYDGITRGDHVKITGRKGKWTFYEHTTNDLGAEWVTVYGPIPGGQFTSVSPDRIRKAKA